MEYYGNESDSDESTNPYAVPEKVAIFAKANKMAREFDQQFSQLNSVIKGIDRTPRDFNDSYNASLMISIPTEFRDLIDQISTSLEIAKAEADNIYGSIKEIWGTYTPARGVTNYGMFKSDDRNKLRRHIKSLSAALDDAEKFYTDLASQVADEASKSRGNTLLSLVRVADTALIVIKANGNRAALIRNTVKTFNSMSKQMGNLGDRLKEIDIELAAQAKQSSANETKSLNDLIHGLTLMYAALSTEEELFTKILPVTLDAASKITLPLEERRLLIPADTADEKVQGELDAIANNLDRVTAAATRAGATVESLSIEFLDRGLGHGETIRIFVQALKKSKPSEAFAAVDPWIKLGQYDALLMSQLEKNLTQLVQEFQEAHLLTDLQQPHPVYFETMENRSVAQVHLDTIVGAVKAVTLTLQALKNGVDIMTAAKKG